MLPSAPHASVLDLIGNTPLVNISSIFDDCHFNLYAKSNSLIINKDKVVRR